MANCMGKERIWVLTLIALRSGWIDDFQGANTLGPLYLYE
jgi:hypothetical protein